MSCYILLGGSLEVPGSYNVIAIHSNVHALRAFAEQYVKSNPCTEVHIFVRVTGYESKLVTEVVTTYEDPEFISTQLTIHQDEEHS